MKKHPLVVAARRTERVVQEAARLESVLPEEVIDEIDMRLGRLLERIAKFREARPVK